MSTEQTTVIGLTGGIASGKSTVTKQLRALGVTVLDADEIARDVVAPGSDGLAAIVEAFGDDLLDSEGALDRTAMGARVFSDPDARATLNAITHPRIAQRFVQATEASIQPWIVYDAALIVENGLQGGMGGLIVVACDSKTQVARVVARDQLSEDDAKARIASQLPLEDKVKVADWVIDNSGTREETRLQVAALFDTLSSTFGALHADGEE